MATANPAEVAAPEKLIRLASEYAALASIRLVHHIEPSGYVRFRAELQEPHPYVCIATFKPSQFEAGKASQLDPIPLLYFVERRADGSGTSSIGVGEDRTSFGSVIHVQNGYDVLTGHRTRESVMEQYTHAYGVLTSYRTMIEPLMAIIERLASHYRCALGRSLPMGELGILNTEDQIFRNAPGSLELLAQIAFRTMK